MAFHEIRFPANLSFGSVGGPERRTEIVALTNGHEERRTPWAHSRRRYDAGLGLRSLDDVAALVAFFEARAGQMHGFRWKDWADFKSCAPGAAVSFQDQEIGMGDGVRRDFALRKAYASGPARYWRPVAKPVEGTVLAGVGNVELRQRGNRLSGGRMVIDLNTGRATVDGRGAARGPDGNPVQGGTGGRVPATFTVPQITL